MVKESSARSGLRIICFSLFCGLLRLDRQHLVLTSDRRGAIAAQHRRLRVKDRDRISSTSAGTRRTTPKLQTSTHVTLSIFHAYVRDGRGFLYLSVLTVEVSLDSYYT